MYKLFTLEEATELLPTVDHTLRDMQSAVKDALELRDTFARTPQGTVKARNLAEEINFLLRGLQESKGELDRLGVHLKDMETGLVDFPSQLGAEVVYLCWEQGQDAITHFHRLNEAESARQPLPDTQAGHVAA